MPLDRQSIEKRDFPIGRRGYEPDAVDEHLAMLADEVEALRRSASRSTRTESLASAASEQVRLIVEAAEQSAADIEREAELEARQIRQDARESAEQSRNDAGSQAREHVGRVTEATTSMLERADTLETEFQAMIETVRSTAGKLGQELRGLQAAVGELRGPGAGPSTDAGEGFEPDAPEPAAEPPLESPLETGDEEGARLIALNMALNGTPREETERYLSDHFELTDTEALLDDVYARAGQ